MRKIETRERIINKAIDLFYKKGFAKASIRDLVKALKLTNAAVYNHFKNKDHLLYVIINRMQSLYFERVNPISEQYDNPLDKLKNIIRQHTSLAIENKKGLKVFFDDLGQLSPKFRHEIINQQRIMYKLLKTQLIELQKNGLLRPVNITLATYCCFGMLNWSYRWYKKNRGLSVEEVGSGIEDIFLYGILNKEKGPNMQNSSKGKIV